MSTRSTRQVGCVSRERPALTMVEVANFLAKNHLDKYADAIVEEGFDDMRTLKLMNGEDAKALVTKNGHRKRLGAALKMPQEQAHEETNRTAGEETEQCKVANFLSELRLDQYHDAIVEDGYDDMATLMLLDEDIKALVPKAGDQKRLQEAPKKVKIHSARGAAMDVERLSAQDGVTVAAPLARKVVLAACQQLGREGAPDAEKLERAHDLLQPPFSAQSVAQAYDLLREVR